MRITCQSIEEFLRCLEAEPPDAVLQKVVRVSRVFRALDDERPPVKLMVTLQASAVVGIMGEEGQFLLQAGEECGVDYRDSTQEEAGTEKADELRKMIREYCDRHGLEVRPGVIDV